MSDDMDFSSGEDYDRDDSDDDHKPCLGLKGKVLKRKRNRNQRRRSKKGLTPEQLVEWAIDACAAQFNDPTAFTTILAQYHAYAKSKSKEASANCDGIISSLLAVH
jgi:hypothetical protein